MIPQPPGPDPPSLSVGVVPETGTQRGGHTLTRGWGPRSLSSLKHASFFCNEEKRKGRGGGQGYRLIKNIPGGTMGGRGRGRGGRFDLDTFFNGEFLFQVEIGGSLRERQGLVAVRGGKVLC